MNMQSLIGLINELRSLILLAVVTAAPIAAAAAQEPPRNFAIHQAPRPLSEIVFVDGNGKPMSIAEFRGKVVLLNIWATWCGPCKREMPTLDHLQATLGGSVFEVVALSIDRAGLDVVRKFYAEVGVKTLPIYVDSSGKAARDLRVAGLPTTLLIDRHGRELGRLVGPAEWDTPEMVEFLKSRIGDTTSVLAPDFRDPTFTDAADPTQIAAKKIRRHGLDLPVTGSPIS